MMDLESAIKHCEEVAEKNESEANFGFGNACIDRSSCLECAKEHRQLATWLRELKAYRNKSQERDDESCDEIWEKAYAERDGKK